MDEKIKEELELKLKKDLMDLIKNFNLNQRELILNAYNFAKEKHEGQKFSSTSYDYFLHPLYSAVLLAKWQRDFEEICAGLLHDVIEDCEVSIWEIKRLFGFRISFLVHSVSYDRNWNYKDKNNPPDREGHFEKIIRNSIVDTGVLFLHLADSFGKVGNLIEEKITPKNKEKFAKRLKYKLEYIYPFLISLGLTKSANKIWESSKDYFEQKPESKISKIISKEELMQLKENLNKEKGIDELK